MFRVGGIAAERPTPSVPNRGTQPLPLVTPKLLPPPSWGRGRPGAGPRLRILPLRSEVKREREREARVASAGAK